MPCGCMELEAKYSQTECKCARYRESFPDCVCERESVSIHSPGRVEDNEVLVRSIFTERLLDREGRVKPTHFRPEPSTRGFSVDRVNRTRVGFLKSSKRKDARFKGYLKFAAARSGDIRDLMNEDGTRLFCIYDTATAGNHAHADICQNVILQVGAENRKKRMMEIAWQLNRAFSIPLPEPPTSIS